MKKMRIRTMSIVPTLFLGAEYCATFQAALYIETHSMMHQSEFHAASVALSRAADKRIIQYSLLTVLSGFLLTVMIPPRKWLAMIPVVQISTSTTEQACNMLLHSIKRATRLCLQGALTANILIT